MGSVLAISIFPPTGSTVEAFLGTVARLHGAAGSIEEMAEYPDGIHAACHVAVRPSMRTVQDAAARVSDSGSYLRVDVSTSEDIGGGVLAEAWLHGSRLVRGGRFADAGPIRIVLPMLSEWVEVRRAPKTGREQGRRGELDARILADLDATFMSLVSCEELPAAFVEHAVAYVDWECMSPPGCMMVYHRSALEVAYDLRRFALEVMCGYCPPQIYVPGVTLPRSLRGVQCSHERAARRRAYFGELGATCVAPRTGRLLDELTWDMASQVALADPDEVLLALMEPLVGGRIHWCAEHGVCLCARPYANLLDVYTAVWVRTTGRSDSASADIVKDRD
jgi:hypothetical protein